MCRACIRFLSSVQSCIPRVADLLKTAQNWRLLHRWCTGLHRYSPFCTPLLQIAQNCTICRRNAQNFLLVHATSQGCTWFHICAPFFFCSQLHTLALHKIAHFGTVQECVPLFVTWPDTFWCIIMCSPDQFCKCHFVNWHSLTGLTSFAQFCADQLTSFAHIFLLEVWHTLCFI